MFADFVACPSAKVISFNSLSLTGLPSEIDFDDKLVSMVFKWDMVYPVLIEYVSLGVPVIVITSDE